MSLEELVKKWKKLIKDANDKGIPMPTCRDPDTGKGSITATLVVMSAFLCAFPIFGMLATVVSHFTGMFTLTDANSNQLMNAFQASIQFFIACLGAYLGRRIIKGPDGSVKMESKDDKPSEDGHHHTRD